MIALGKLKRLKISTKLSSVLAAALLSLCVMGTIAVFAARGVQQLGEDLYRESSRVATVEMALSVAIEKAIGIVSGVPAELDLQQVKAKQEKFQSTLNEAKATLQAMLAATAAGDVKQSGDRIITALASFQDASAKVFEFTASFAQPDAIAALANAVAPAEKALHAAFKQFHEAAERNSAAKIATIEATSKTITSTVIGLAIFFVLAISSLGYLTVFRGVARPIAAMNVVMRRLSGGDSEVEIPYLSRGDELGEIAQAVGIFKQNRVERIRLEAEQKETAARAATDRAAEMQRLADGFEAAVGDIVGTVSSASTELEAAASTLTSTATTTQQLSGSVAAASEQASANVQSVASAADEMAASINEISRQVQESSNIAGEAVRQAAKTDARISELSSAAQRIGDVVKLITAIADQTNLLALNATIEAARAGEAGRGFAVVAQEVKALASQTAKATEEISTQVDGMQAATQESVTSIKEIGGIINRVSEIAGAIAAAVEEQGASTQEISRNIRQAAAGTTQVAANITDVSHGAKETGSASGQVLASAQSLSRESGRLRTEVQKFLTTVRAA